MRGRQTRERLVDRFPADFVRLLARAAGVGGRAALAALAPEALQRALETIPRRDLQRVCERLGYGATGSPRVLASRIAGAGDVEKQTRRWRPFAEARAWARSLQLTGQKQYLDLMRTSRPADIPAVPYATYRGEWISWGDWLGTGNPFKNRIEYRPFAEAREFARSLRFPNVTAWRQFCKTRIGNRRVLPADIPAAPYLVYDEWKDFGDWLGTGYVAARNRTFRSYAATRSFARKLGIRSEPDWIAWCRGDLFPDRPRPADIPSNPARVYRGTGWTTWGEFTGSGSVACTRKTFRSYRAARDYVRKQGILDNPGWRVWSRSDKRPADIPSSPDRVYRGKGWVSWGEFFGTGTVHPSRLRRPSFAEARAFVRKLRLKNRAAFARAWHDGRIPREIPFTIEKNPSFRDWEDFLGTSGVAPT